MKKTLILLAWIALCVMTGFISSRFQTEALASWYPTLNKPALTPPDIAFPIAWTFLYFCMGISAALITFSHHTRKPFLLSLFLVQLLCNFLWTIAFFYFRSPLAGLVVIVVLEILIIFYALRAYPVSKAASLLFVPYILWVAFATYLNLYILLYN